MDIRHLRTFLALCKYKSFTKTALHLGCAQSGVTTQIKQLETELSVQLFDRIGKTVSLTPEGMKLLPYATHIVSLNDDIKTLYTDSGRITIGMYESVAPLLTGSILKEYRSLFPEIEIVLKIIDSCDYLSMLALGQLDLVMILDLPVRDKFAKVLAQRRENISLYASATHDITPSSTLSPEDFLHLPILLPQTDTCYRKLFEHELLSHGIEPKIALECNNISVLKEAAQSGIGLCLLPEYAVRQELNYHILERVNYRTNYSVSTQLLIHRDKWIPSYLESFIEIACRHLQ